MIELLNGLDRFKNKSLDGCRDGALAIVGRITDDMRTSNAHGNITYATRTSYNARVVGRGETGASVFNTAKAAVNELNPGHLDVSTVRINGELGVIIDAPTNYQVFLEVKNAGAKAVLGPTINKWAKLITAAAAKGSKKAL